MLNGDYLGLNSFIAIGEFLSSADNFYKQFGPTSEPNSLTEKRPDEGAKQYLKVYPKHVLNLVCDLISEDETKVLSCQPRVIVTSCLFTRLSGFKIDRSLVC